MLVKDNIYTYLNFKGITPTEAERKLKWGVGALTKPNSITSDRLKEFILLFNDVSSEWLLTGKGEMIKENNPNYEISSSDNNIVISREVLNQISKLTEIVLSQQKTIESMQEERKKILVQMGQPAICANASGSDISTIGVRNLNTK